VKIKGKDFRMPKKLKQKWIVALRSGKYEQGTDYLRKNNRYCCLGVLGDISPKWDWPAEEDQDMQLLSDHVKDREDRDVILPQTIQINLSGKNDGGWSFNRIAGWVEKYL